jgi:hypothetical protein
MEWCEANGVHFVFGLAKNDRLIDAGRWCALPRLAVPHWLRRGICGHEQNR